MNCVPTTKIIYVKSKTKYVPSATQKYEQRIKESKQKHDSQLLYQNLQEMTMEPQHCSTYIDDFIRKRKEIDQWRKDVMHALEKEARCSTNSTDLTDSQMQSDLSTLTESNTLCSQMENQKKLNNSGKNVNKPLAEEYGFKIQKSPSIPLYQSNSKVPLNGMNVSNDTLFYDYYTKQSNDSKISIDYNDEVFAQSNSSFTSNHVGNSTDSSSSVHFINPKYGDSINNNNNNNNNHNPKSGINVCSKVISVPSSRQIYFPACNYNHKYENPNEKNFENNYLYQKAELEINNIKHSNSIFCKVPCNQFDTLENNQDKLLYSSKKTLHKNETNAKLVLKPINSGFNVNQPPSSFVRTRSLNIKRSTVNTDEGLMNPMFPTKYENAIYKDKRNSFYSTDRKHQFPSNEIYNGQKNFHYGQLNYIILKPTFSQENVSNQIDHSYNKESPMIKMSSYTNLQTTTRPIPKVSLNEPLTMKFVFKSEPSLLVTL